MNVMNKHMNVPGTIFVWDPESGSGYDTVLREVHMIDNFAPPAKIIL